MSIFNPLKKLSIETMKAEMASGVWQWRETRADAALALQRSERRRGKRSASKLSGESCHSSSAESSQPDNVKAYQ